MLLLSRMDGNGLTYNRYRAIGFLKPEKKKKYQNADRISAQLAIIMRTLLVKRLDSSFHAFKESLCRFRDATGVMRDMFARGTIYIAPNLNVTEFLMEGREEELIAKIQERQPTDPTIEICSPSDFEPGFTDGLESDWRRLDELYTEWQRVEEDPKLDEFLRHLKDGLFDARINRQHKLVVFSESEETTAYLLDKLTHAGYKRVLTVSSKTRSERMPLVRANFDANFKEQANDYDILISTEVLAEGVNLHTEKWGTWRSAEMFAELTGPNDPPIPRLKDTTDDLAVATRYLNTNEMRSAAVYVRSAFESRLRTICEDKHVKLDFKQDPKKVSADMFWNAILARHTEMVKQGKEFLDPGIIPGIEATRSQVLNRLAHDGGVGLTRQDVFSAIDSMRKFRACTIPYKP